MPIDERFERHVVRLHVAGAQVIGDDAAAIAQVFGRGKRYAFEIGDPNGGVGWLAAIATCSGYASSLTEEMPGLLVRPTMTAASTTPSSTAPKHAPLEVYVVVRVMRGFDFANPSKSLA